MATSPNPASSPQQSEAESSRTLAGTTTKVPLPSRAPLPLSSSQEGQVRDLYYKRVRTKCADEIREFAACASNRTFSAPFMCRAQRRTMNTCMLKYQNQAEQDAARAEWFATIEQRRREREAKEEKRKEQEKFHREWWGLDEQGNRVEKVEKEKK